MSGQLVLTTSYVVNLSREAKDWGSWRLNYPFFLRVVQPVQCFLTLAGEAALSLLAHKERTPGGRESSPTKDWTPTERFRTSSTPIDFNRWWRCPKPDRFRPLVCRGPLLFSMQSDFSGVTTNLHLEENEAQSFFASEFSGGKKGALIVSSWHLQPLLRARFTEKLSSQLGTKINDQIL